MSGRLCALLFALGIQAQATTIVAIWTPAKIVISGDSLLNNYFTGANGATQRRLSTGCKIRKFGATYISAAGNYRIRTAGFDIWDTAARACGTSENVELCAVRFKADLERRLERVVGIHDVNLTVLVAGLQSGSPAMEHITFEAQRNGRLRVRSESFRRGKQTWGRVILGDRNAIDSYERGAASTMTSSLEDQALSLVRIEARAMPQEVGAPFSVLRIEPGGDRWVSGGVCSK